MPPQVNRPAGPGRPLLAVLDYPGRRPEAAVADLRLEEHGFDVRYLLTEPLPGETGATAYARCLVERIEPDRPVTAVLAYCLAASIGHEVAAVLAENAPPVPLVLFDAAPGNPLAVVEAYRSAVGQLGGGMADGPDLTALAEDRSGAADLVAAVRRTLLRLATAALLEDGDEPEDVMETAEQLADHHLRWVVHLIAATDAGSPSWGGDVLHVTSRDHPFREDWRGARRTRTVRIDCTRPALLRTPATARAVLSSLSAPAAASLIQDADHGSGG